MITTIKIKDLLKYLVILTGTIVIIVLMSRYFFYSKEKVNASNKKEKIIANENNNFALLSCFNVSMPITAVLETPSKEKESLNNIDRNSKATSSRSGLTRILDLELLNIQEKEDNEIEDSEKRRRRGRRND